MINIQETSQITKIYLVTNCFGDPNKVYIGKEKEFKISSHRYDYHKLKFGKDIIFTYIDQVESLDSKDWKPLECFWIEYFRQLGFDLQNKNKGGGGCSFLSKETRNKISKALTGRKCSFETKEKMSKSSKGKIFSKESRERMSIGRKGQGSKPILQYDLEGNFIQKWNSIKEASKQLGISNTTISNCCVGHLRSCYGFIFSFTPIKENYKYIKNKTSSKKINQYDLDGNLIKEWDSTTDVSNILGFNSRNISMCLTGNIKTAYKFIWKYKTL